MYYKHASRAHRLQRPRLDPLGYGTAKPWKILYAVGMLSVCCRYAVGVLLACCWQLLYKLPHCYFHSHVGSVNRCCEKGAWEVLRKKHGKKSPLSVEVSPLITTLPRRRRATHRDSAMLTPQCSRPLRRDRHASHTNAGTDASCRQPCCSLRLCASSASL